MELLSRYNELKAIIDRVDFSRIWRGFKPLGFALYDDESCCFEGKMIEKTAGFLANTAIVFNGEHIAIWNLKEHTDADILASKLIHEMFHVFQSMNNESRWPNELEALSRYRCDTRNLSIKSLENRLIAMLAERFDTAEFERLLGLRRMRCDNFGYEYGYEAAVEQIEGTARYVELCALKQISREKYEQSLASVKRSICDTANIIPIRVISYEIGALLLSILKEYELADFEDFCDTPFAMSLIDDKASADADYADKAIETLVESYYAETRRIISGAKERADCVDEGAFKLLGVNVYDARYSDGCIVSTSFVMYEDEGRERVQYGDFVIELNERGGIKRILRM